MKNKLMLSFFGVVVAVLSGEAPNISHAADLTAAEKLKRISEIAAHQPLYLFQHSQPWCGDFLKDLQADGKKMQAIEPLFKTEDENDPRLQQYHACDYGTERYKETPDSEQAYYSIESVGQRAFQFYKVTNPSNHKTVDILYGELIRKLASPNQRAGYSIVNVDQCVMENQISVHQSLSYHEDYTRDNYNLMATYAGKVYVFDIYDMRDRTDTKPHYWLDVRPVFEKTKTGDSCSWSALPQAIKK